MGETLLVDDRDDLLDVLAKEEYRELLSELRTRPDEVTSLTELTDGRHTHESGKTAATIRLHYVIFPELDDAGLVDYDPVEHTVRYRSNERLESWLDTVEDGGGRDVR